MIVIIRRLLVVAAAAALLGIATACSALLGPSSQESIEAGIDERVDYLETVLGADDASAFNVPRQVMIDGLTYTNSDGLGEYRVTFAGCPAPVAITYGQVDDEGVVIKSSGWFGRVPGEDEVNYTISATDNPASLTSVLCSELYAIDGS